MTRIDNRKPDQLRPYEIIMGAQPHAHGSCLIKMGGTHVLCAATVEEKLPHFLRDKGHGWITAEYGMLPCSTHTRSNREAARGKQSGRTQEIQRLIGRSLRASVDLQALGERQIKIDCDVILADGGTRCAAITGAYMAMHQALQGLITSKKLTTLPLRDQVAAVSCGIVSGTPVLDLCYVEDSAAQADANFVLTQSGKIIEIQATAEDAPFSKEEYAALFALAENGVKTLFAAQLKIMMATSKATVTLS